MDVILNGNHQTTVLCLLFCRRPLRLKMYQASCLHFCDHVPNVQCHCSFEASSQWMLTVHHVKSNINVLHELSGGFTSFEVCVTHLIPQVNCFCKRSTQYLCNKWDIHLVLFPVCVFSRLLTRLIFSECVCMYVTGVTQSDPPPPSFAKYNVCCRFGTKRNFKKGLGLGLRKILGQTHPPPVWEI